MKILSSYKNKFGQTAYNFICPYCGEKSKSMIYFIKRGRGCMKCSGKRITKSKLKTHKEYVEELKIKNPLVKVIDVYVNDNTKIKHKCSVCGRKDWLVLPTNVLQGVSMCESCNKSNQNSYFAEIAQQYLKNINIAIPEYDIYYKPLAYYDLYIPTQNLLIEIQSEFHDTREEKDLEKKNFAESQGYNIEWIDIREIDILSFLKRFDKNVTWDKIYKNIDLSKISKNLTIVQLDIGGNLVNTWYKGLTEINNVLTYSLSRLSLATRGLNDGFKHYYKNYLWYLYDEYITLDKNDIQKVTEEMIEKNNLKEGNYLYLAIKDNVVITGETMKELANKIHSEATLVNRCLKGRSKTTQGFIIKRVLKDDYK